MKVLQILFFILLTVGFAYSQNATINGSIYFGKDKIEGVIIKAVESNGKVFEAKTDFEGKYKILLPKGLFTVTLNHCAYEFEERKININSKRNLVINFQPKIYIPHGCNFDEREVEVEFTQISNKLLNVEKAILTGNVYDPTGAVIAEAKVTAVSKNGEKFETLTNQDGVYELNLPFDEYKPRISNQKIATYEITVESRGFVKFVLKDFKFVNSSKGKMNLDFSLDIGEWENTSPISKQRKKQ